MKLALDVEGGPFGPGDTVSGTVRVLEGGRSRSLQVALAFRERTSDYQGTGQEVTTGPLHQGDLEAGQSFSFSLRLPADALPPCTSAHGQLWWEVDAKSDEFGPDTHERRPIDVSAPR